MNISHAIRALPSLDGLRAFHVAATLRSFSRASEVLHVTQSAISHRIRALEESLGVQLFARRRRPIELTPAGEVLARAAEQAFAHLEEGIEQLDALEHDDRLTVSCSPSFAVRWLVPHLTAFQLVAPELDVRINADDRVVEPGRRGIDVCIRYGPGGYEDVDAEALGEETLTPVCSPMMMAQRPLRHPEQLVDYPLLHDDVLADHPGHVGWCEWLDAAGVARAGDCHGPVFSHSYMAIDAAIAGQGVALARRTLITRELAMGRLVAPFTLAVPTALRYWIVTPRELPEDAPAAKFRAWLREAVRQELAAP